MSTPCTYRRGNEWREEDEGMIIDRDWVTFDDPSLEDTPNYDALYGATITRAPDVSGDPENSPVIAVELWSPDGEHVATEWLDDDDAATEPDRNITPDKWAEWVAGHVCDHLPTRQ